MSAKTVTSLFATVLLALALVAAVPETTGTVPGGQPVASATAAGDTAVTSDFGWS